jgi:hypothetical protein
MEGQILDIKVYVDDDYVYMSTKDWLKIVKVLGNISYSWTVNEEKKGDPKVFIADKLH